MRWCTEHNLALFAVRRADIECFGRELEAKGKARATVARRLTTIVGFYRYAEDEGLIAVSPRAHVRRPRVDMESHAVGLDRNEVGGILVVAGLGHPREHALISLLALNGLRISRRSGPTSRTWASSGATGPCWSGARAARSSASPSPPGRPGRSTSPWANEWRARCSSPPRASASTATARPASCAGSRDWPGSPSG